MSAQGATLRRGTAHMPIWPVAALVTVAAATLIGINMIDEAPSQGVVTSVTQTERLANSSAAIREQGAVLPVVVGISHVTPKSVGFAGPRVRRAPTSPRHRRSHPASRTRAPTRPRSQHRLRARASS